MHFGAMMSALENEGHAAQALAALGDVVLLAEVGAMGELHDETPGEYVVGASRRFAAMAGDEDWLALMNALERADDPARAALEKMVRWSLARDAREAEQARGEADGGCGGAHCGCGHGA